MKIKEDEFTDAALHKNTVSWLVAFLKREKPRFVLEFGLGQGVGTRTILNNCDANVTSVEHQYRWVEHAKVWNNTVDRLDIVDYSFVPKKPYDVVIIDGKDRYECLQSIWNDLKDGTHIILDDANRKNEKAIVKKWKDELGLELDLIKIGRGISYGKK